MEIIKSSEIASYLFCPVSWWIGKTKGVKITKSIGEGEEYHKLVSENQSKARFLHICSIIIILIIIALIMWRLLG